MFICGFHTNGGLLHKCLVGLVKMALLKIKEFTQTVHLKAYVDIELEDKKSFCFLFRSWLKAFESG